MTDFRRVTDNFYVSPQITVDDVEAAATQGFEALIMNRPDAEQPNQPATAEITNAAAVHGMSFHHIPITAPPQPDDVAATANALNVLGGKKVLAFCRSGTRSVTLWVYAQVAEGKQSVHDALSAAERAGYDLWAHEPLLDSLAG